ncbi:response regulator transcription factor [bacterium]|nr:response regulator transcription factor [bacterium]MBU1957475.1 response regulator transcription factor [bacterium]
MKILLLEDDTVLLETLCELLKQHGFDVTAVEKGQHAIDMTFENSYDIYLFDINLPDMNGIDLLKSLKEADDQTPAIFISANEDIQTIAKGFDVGAEDYIKKPFMPEELLIRLNAKLSKKMVICYQNVRYNTVSGDIFIDNKKVYLSYAQFKLVDMLFRNIDKAVTKDELLDVTEYHSDNALRVAITKLKTLLNIEIKNIRGVGYTIESC